MFDQLDPQWSKPMDNKAKHLENKAFLAERINELNSELAALRAENEALRNKFIESDHEIEQILGKALVYPWYKDDLGNFPKATEKDGVCVGEHVPATLAMEIASKYEALRRRLEEAEKWIEWYKKAYRGEP